MTMIPVYIATEDELSEVVLRRILRDLPLLMVSRSLRRGGFGYLRRNIQAWNQAAKGVPFIVLTDLDQTPCASDLIVDWLRPHSRHPNLLLRVAVREVESWLLADRDHLTTFLKVTGSPIPDNPDALGDPKATLVQLARRSRNRSIREDIAPMPGSTAKQGPNYNGALCPFVEKIWSPSRAREKSRSLNRAMQAIEALHSRNQSDH